jgi:Rad3-related DNA helicase
VDRAREIFSASLFKSGFNELKKAFKTRKKGLVNKLGVIFADIVNEINNMAQEIPEGENVQVKAKTPYTLHGLLRDMLENMDTWLAQNAGGEHFEIALNMYFNVFTFLRVFDNMDERYTVYIERNRNEIEITLLCLDPSGDIAAALAKSQGAVFFSATLTPLNYHKNIFGGAEADKTARLPSPFDRSCLCVAVENRISTKYKDRTEHSFSNTADAIYEMYSSKKGNYFAFFTSYAYLDNVLKVFTDKYPDVKTHVQDREMDESGREAYLSEFYEGNNILAFAVMGGVFSEGIDLTGERLIGAAIVGVGLPLISPKRDALRNHYDSTISSGFEYAYMFPGMNKVMQAAGRVIRAETDRGVILLIDTRFTDRRYLELFPHEWRGFYKPGRVHGVADIFKHFWEA